MCSCVYTGMFCVCMCTSYVNVGCVCVSTQACSVLKLVIPCNIDEGQSTD